MPPEENSVETWALAYLNSTELSYKLAPPPPPSRFTGIADALPSEPGRPPELRRAQGPQRLHDPRRSAVARRKLIHTFFHHELQAAELMCWALLRFTDAPLGWRKGLLSICLDEIRHMGLYAEYLKQNEYPVGSMPVRDWFWTRVPTCQTPLQFAALMNIGMEGANLEHTRRFAIGFREAGDEAGALIQEQIEAEEVAHVAFGRHWFEQFSGGLSFARWMAELPPPLSPLMMRGKPLNRGARRQAGFTDTFLDELEAWQPDTPGS
jgi:uncharacterized ferritin-like protein (DUF455 family)